MLEYLDTTVKILIYIYIFLFGACMGSFLNCMALRIVKNESPFGRSRCDSCGHELGFLDLFPIFSFICFRGKCRYCGTKLDISYLLTEIVSGFVSLSILLKYQLSLETIEYLILANLLLLCTFSDLKGYIIPDSAIVIGIITRLIFVFIRKESILVTLLPCILVVFLYLFVSIYEKIKKMEMMGGGDIKLLFMLGMYLSLGNLVLCLLFSCVFGIVYALVFRARDKVFPWGPSICAAAYLCLFIGDKLVKMYISLF